MKPLAVLTLSIILVLPLAASAKTPSILPDPGMLPSSSFYFLKSWKEGIELLFTWNVKAKAEKHLYLAEVRLAEYQKLIANGDIEEATATLKKYQEHRDKALEKAKGLNEQDAAEVKIKEDEDNANLQAVLTASLSQILAVPSTSEVQVESAFVPVQVQ